jgi:hypothetical protein
MAETKSITFDYKEIAELLVKKQEIHDGHWGIYFEFGLAAANLGPSPEELRPAAVVPILKIGIQRFDEPTNLSVDASIVNPPSGSKSKRPRSAASGIRKSKEK